jgi:hypothetical protein
VEVARKKDPTELGDHYVNVWSLAFSKDTSALSEKLQNVLYRTLTLLNGQRNARNHTIGSLSKLPDRVAEVLEQRVN